MSGYGVLTNRKRAGVALIHSVVFLGVAFHGFVEAKPGVLHGLGTPRDFVLVAVYLIVASILMWLVSISRGLIERVYFGLCVTSATSGLLRTVFGDRVVPPAQYVRVLMLGSAVAVGIMIVRSYSRSAIATEKAAFPAEASQD